jgi:hypothetical protein
VTRMTARQSVEVLKNEGLVRSEHVEASSSGSVPTFRCTGPAASRASAVRQTCLWAPQVVAWGAGFAVEIHHVETVASGQVTNYR